MSKMKLSKKWRKSAFVVAVMAVVAAAGLAVGHVLREVREGQTAKDVQLGRSLVHQPHLGQGDGGNMLSTSPQVMAEAIAEDADQLGIPT
jgi:hypothetical protein